MADVPTADEMMEGMHKAISGSKGAASTKPAKPTLEATDEKKRLRSVIDRIVRLEEEKKGLGADIKEIYEEAKSAGSSKKSIRIVVKREMEDSEQRASREAAEEEAELILAALGDFASSPLGEAATRKH